MSRPLIATLRDAEGHVSATLLASFFTSHAEVLQIERQDEAVHQGIPVRSANFLHLPSGLRYVIAIAELHNEAPPAVQPQEESPR